MLRVADRTRQKPLGDNLDFKEIIQHLEVIGSCNQGRSVLHRDKVFAGKIASSLSEGVADEQVPLLKTALLRKKAHIDSVWRDSYASDPEGSTLCHEIKQHMNDALARLERLTSAERRTAASA